MLVKAATAGVEGKNQPAGLEVVSITSYEGPFLEDRSCDEVVNVAAMILENKSKILYKDVFIEIATEKGKLQFYVDLIPSGIKVVALELNRAQWHRQKILHTKINAKTQPQFNAEQLRIRSVGATQLELTNLSDRPMSDIRLLHKGYLAEPDFYMGGISYETIVPYLAAGQSCVIRPACYSKGYSIILMAEYK